MDRVSAIATAVRAQRHVRYPDVRIVGRYDHVGTPRRFRRDAALAGAEIALALARVQAECEAAGGPMAVTFGRFHTDAAAHGLTTVPGECRFSLDMRAYAPDVLAALEAAFLAAVTDVSERRGVAVVLGPCADAGIGTVSPRIRDGLARAAEALGIPTRPLGSPASHAAAFAKAGVPLAMLFVRNANGSENPDEAMAIDDLLDSVAIHTAWLVAETCPA